MDSYRTHSWPYVVDAFGELSAAVPSFAPLSDAVAHVAASPYAPGLFPLKSMNTLRLYQQDHYATGEEHLRLDYEDGELVLRYHSALAQDRRFALRVEPGVWTKRGPDVIALLDRAFHHLRWFVEYRTTTVEDGRRNG